jgi:hypothetical protein
MTAFQWENILLDDESLVCLEEIKSKNSHYSNTGDFTAPTSTREENVDKLSTKTDGRQPITVYNENSDEDFQMSLVSAERTCGSFIKELDESLKILDEVSASYDDVTGRTNTLMLNCENLLEQQVLYISATISSSSTAIIHHSIYLHYIIP